MSYAHTYYFRERLRVSAIGTYVLHKEAATICVHSLLCTTYKVSIIYVIMVDKISCILLWDTGDLQRTTGYPSNGRQTVCHIAPDHSEQGTHSQKARFTWPTWGPTGYCRPQVGPMWAPWTLLSGLTRTWQLRECIDSLQCSNTMWCHMHGSSLVWVMTWRRTGELMCMYSPLGPLGTHCWWNFDQNADIFTQENMLRYRLPKGRHVVECLNHGKWPLSRRSLI